MFRECMAQSGIYPSFHMFRGYLDHYGICLSIRKFIGYREQSGMFRFVHSSKGSGVII